MRGEGSIWFVLRARLGRRIKNISIGNKSLGDKLSILRLNLTERKPLCRRAIIIFAATIAMVELGVAHLLVTTTFNIILGGVCLALALAFGLGAKDAVARYLEELKDKGKITLLEKE